jgi:hypothetical protein
MVWTNISGGSKVLLGGHGVRNSQPHEGAIAEELNRGATEVHHNEQKRWLFKSAQIMVL